MAASLNIAGDIAIESDVPTHSRVQIVVRKEQATVSRGTEILEQKGGVLAVEQPESRAWLIRFDDGTVWAAKMPVRKSGGCGCS